MPTGTKAVLIHLNAYLAQNNIKRNIGSFVANVQNANDDLVTKSATVLAGAGTYSHAPTAGNLIHILATNVPLTVAVTFAGGGSFTKVMNELMVLDIEIASIVFTNNDVSDNANLTIITG